MELGEALAEAIRMIASRDPDVVSAAEISLRVSVLATAFAALLGIPVGFLVGSRRFRGRRAAELLLGTLTAMPTVVVGLLVYSLLSRRGLLGPMGLLYTPTAIVAGETVLAAPLMAALTMAVVAGADPRIHETALTLGASRWRAAWTVLAEVRRGLVAAIATTFGRLIAELGIALMAGGNIRGSTRTLTTAIALETAKGEFAFGLALGLILLALALLANVGAWMMAPGR